MAKNRRHLKRHSMPTSWPAQRKSITFITKPNPGSMKRDYVVAAVVLLRDILGLVHTTKEAKYVVNKEYVKVNGVIIKNIKAPIGMFDIVEIEKTGQKLSFVFDTLGRIKVVDVKGDSLLVKVANKTLVKGGNYQINGFGGFNTIVSEKEAAKIVTGSTLVVDLVKKKVSKVLALDVKSKVYIMDGKYVGLAGDVKEVTKYNGVAPDLVTINTKDGEYTTALSYCFVVDELGRVE